ncbi:hypothetical protein [Aquabacter cavernae]|uniref:hypothetical protein n=1 Tax=Aquabacter cavernae TaxID=2496029 RepID=UPI000F8D4A93|nr:hypothetical protein [Aquabacter cavernae]
MKRFFQRSKGQGHRQQHRRSGSRSRFGLNVRVPRPIQDLAARVPRPDFARLFGNLKATLAAHPRRAAGFGVLGLLLLVFVATTSLPLALMSRAPGLALILAPNNAVVLKGEALQARIELNRLIAAQSTPPDGVPGAQEPAIPRTADGTDPAATDPSASDPGASGAPATDPSQTTETSADADGVPALPSEAGDTPLGTQEQIDATRAVIAELADRILARAPLDAEAMRLKAEMERDPEVAERDMRAAYARSRREPVAALWLLNQSYVRHDYPDVLDKANALLRTMPALSKFALSYLYALASDPEGRPALAAELATSPPWRKAFFNTLGDFVSNENAVALFIAMKEAGAPPEAKELGPYLTARLFKAKDADGSFNTWLQLLSDAELAALLPVRNLDFATDPSGLPFDWQIGRGRNVTARFVRIPGQQHERALRIQFGVGRVRFGGVLQVAALRPGSYVFSGRQAGNMSAKRGMKWQVRCFPSNTLAGESSQLFGSPRGWQDFSFDITLPEAPGCSVQVVRLVHDARSASEEYASGEVSFSGLQVKPVVPDETSETAPPEVK